jgi:ABC-type antimicrobial peptide transport system permease subunit
MNPIYLTKLSLRKLRFYPNRTLLLVIPVSVLLGLGIAISTSAENIKSALEQSVLGTIAESSRLITLSKLDFQTNGGGGGPRMVSFSADTTSNYTSADVDKIKGISGVTAASIPTAVQSGEFTSTDLIAEETYKFNNPTAITAEVAEAYTGEDFTYTEGEPIPIILSSNSFFTQYEDWKDQTSISIPAGRGSFELNNDAMPIKTKTLEYDKEDLIGTEFTATIGGLSALETYTQEFSDSNLVFKKYTAEELAADEAARRDAISPYWNYDALNTPITYTFKVVGIIEDESVFGNYIPETFASKLMSDLVTKQLNARTSAELTVSDLTNKFTGINFDGVEIKNNIFSFGGGMARAVRISNDGGSSFSIGGPAGGPAGEEQTAYPIPGLVVKVKRDANANAFSQPTIESVFTEANVYDQAVKTGQTILIRVADLFTRGSVVEQLNALGYSYQDVVKTSVYTSLRDNLNAISIGFTAAFAAIFSFVSLSVLSRFVSDGTKEIGIFRALGAKAGQIRSLFLLHGFFAILLAGVVGTLLGLGLTVLSRSAAANWFDANVMNGLRASYDVVTPVNSAVFSNLSSNVIGVYLLILVGLGIICTLIPSIRASRISPISAIRNE